MPLTDMFRRASTYILGGEEGSKMAAQLYEDNEVLFCKNNVCVHPPAIVRQDTDVLHHPGYLTVTSKVFVDQHTDNRRPTLFLTWIPNATLAKNYDPQRLKTSMESLNSTDSSGSDRDHLVIKSIAQNTSTNPFLNNYDGDYQCNNDTININVDISNPEIEIVSTPDGSDVSPTAKFEFSRSESITSNESSWMFATTPEFLAQKHNLEFLSGSCCSSPILQHKLGDSGVSITYSNSSNCFPFIHESKLKREREISWSGFTQELDQLNEKQLMLVATQLLISLVPKHKCRRFSVDLSQMRSLRLFFNDNTCTCGQLVVASRESQYKILHFHHGGLDHLAQVLHQWHSILHSTIANKTNKADDNNLPYRHFMVCRPEVSDLELHPEEGQVPKLTEETFRLCFNEAGQLEDDLTLRKSVFFAGMERSLRREVWPFLLHVYPYSTTLLERVQIAEIRRGEYEEITRRRLDLTGGQLAQFRRKIYSVIEKDVVRTDRSNPFFSGDDNPNLDIMKNILLNYAIYNPTLGYTQGMSDLLAPVLCELKDEVAAFWCFVGLMQRAVFVATPTDRDMDRSLRFLRELVKLMVPKFYKHLEKHKDAGELLFCHRWILLCFKREFTEPVALRMWESCWANYLTDYFHLFLCLAIICVYAEDVIAQDLRADEMLLHFSSLAMYMDGQVIARKARGLLHQFRQLREIPCSLSGLCTKCGPGIWDSSHSPRIYCVGHDNSGQCNN